MKTDRSLTRLGVHLMAHGLRERDFSAAELLEAHLELIMTQDRALNAWVFLDLDRARDAAVVADRQIARARRGGRSELDDLPYLTGIPVALKDLVVTRGRPSTAGSRILEGFIGPYNAHIAERIEAAGAVVVGKTNMDEFAMGSSTEHSAWGPTANPWDLSRVPGGSSGGSAAAVAAFHVPLAIGSDTGGSIRQPAAMCGVVGMKPTYGRVSRFGIVAFASSLDQVGPIGRDVRDAAVLLQIIAGRDERDSTSAPEPVQPYALLHDGVERAAAALRGARIGVPRQYFVAGMEPGVEARIREAIAAMGAAGAEVVDVDLPHTDYGVATYYIIAPAEASANLARYDGIRFGHSVRDGDVLGNYLASRGTGFGPEVKRRIMLGTYALSAGYYDAFYLKAQKVRTLIKGDFDRAFESVDAIVTPVSPTVAFPLGSKLADPVAMYLADVCTIPVNVAGLPGLSVPCGLSEGLPVGLQFIGRPFEELRLFQLGRAYEAITAGAEWRHREPTDLPRLDNPATPAMKRAAGAATGGRARG